MNEDFLKALLKSASSATVIEDDKVLNEMAKDVAARIYALFSALMEEGFDREEAFAITLATLPN